MNIKPIHDDEDLDCALDEIEGLMESDPQPGTTAGDRLEILSTLVESYESRHFPIDAPDPIEAIKFRLDQLGLGIRDLQPAIGTSSRVYEVLAGSRPLTIRMIRNLNAQFNIPAEVLIRESKKPAGELAVV